MYAAAAQLAASDAPDCSGVVASLNPSWRDHASLVRRLGGRGALKAFLKCIACVWGGLNYREVFPFETRKIMGHFYPTPVAVDAGIPVHLSLSSSELFSGSYEKLLRHFGKYILRSLHLCFFPPCIIEYSV